MALLSSPQGDQRNSKKIFELIESELSRLGLLCRVFYRVKSETSIRSKIDREPNKYSENGRKIQDLYGIRVALYFEEDLKLAQEAIKTIFDYDENSSTIDIPDQASFSASRCNLVFRLPQDLVDESDLLRKIPELDSSFEVQFRTILSEGWHEVEHDLRYKCKADWEKHDDLSRALNGIYASLETSDWGMKTLFNDLAYRHYKACEWPQMLRTKFRLRAGNGLNENISALLTENADLGKSLYRVNRTKFILKLLRLNIDLPVTLDNIFYLSNIFFIKSESANALIPEPVSSICREAIEKSKTSPASALIQTDCRSS